VPYAGEALALAAALLWACAVVLFKKSGETVHPVALNTFKDVLALVLYVPTIYLAGGTLLFDAPPRDYAILCISGVLGIAVGDTLLFQSLNMIGASRSALVSCLYSPFIIALSVAFIGERLDAVQLVGVVLIVGGVFEATRSRGRALPVERRRLLAGVALGVLAELVMAVGVVIVKPVLARAPLLWAVEIRLAAGVVALLVYLLFHPRRRRIVGSLIDGGMRPVTLIGSVIGGYGAMMLWLGGFKLTQASIAAALNQTNAIFVLVLAAAFLGERITRLRALAIAAAVAGAIMVTVG